MSLTQLGRLLPLPEEELKQVLEYAATLSKTEAAEHFTNLLGDSPQVIDFVASFNSRRSDINAAPSAPSTSGASTGSGPDNATGGVPRPKRNPKKQKPALHTPAPRQVASLGPTPGKTYNKRDQQDDYISGRSGMSTPSGTSTPPTSHPPAPTSAPAPAPAPTEPSTAALPPLKRSAPSSAGTLVSELGLPKQKQQQQKSNPTSRTGTPGPSTKSNNNAQTTRVSIVGGTPMHGASTALADLDDAIRALEITTNPTHAANSAAARRCNCVATRHPLQRAAPNCLNCGKVICVKEGLGPCTFCGTPLLGASEVQAMIRELKQERGQEKMAANNRDAQRAYKDRDRDRNRDRDDEIAAAEAKAREHRDKLLGFQAQNAQRTTVRDEAADFDMPHAGGSMWATPEERARELKKQQKLLREMEWNARPDYEKRQQVLSIDLVGGKVVRRMAAVERPPSPEEEEEEDAGDAELVPSTRTEGGGAFSRNPLLTGMIKPVYDAKGKGAELEGRNSKPAGWRRVQDDLDDNEAVILDGGIHYAQAESQAAAGDEPGRG